MSATKGGAGQSESFASEPFEPSTLTLNRRNDKLAELHQLRERCGEAVGSLTIDHEVGCIRALIQDKALDEEFSVAVRERWQNWSRNTNPFRSGLASSAASELNQAANRSDTGSDTASGDSATDEPKEAAETSSSQKNKRRKAFRADEIKVQVGTSQLDVTEGWETIRRDREARLSDMDAALPSAFRFDDRQLQVYAHRLKPKYINSLDRPFEASSVHGLLRPSRDVSPHLRAPTPQPVSFDEKENEKAFSQPNVFVVSFFTGSLDLGREGPMAQHKGSCLEGSAHQDGDITRDEYVKRICGDGLGGMKRSQTIELLSTQTLAHLQSSLVCWSDEQPERRDWRKRLHRQLSQHGMTELSSDADLQRDLPSQLQSETSGLPSFEEGKTKDEERRDVRFARFTGGLRETDTALIIEDKLYSKGFHHGGAASEAAYLALLEEWKRSSGHAGATVGWSSNGGDFSTRLDQLKSIRVGQPYWMIHQGDCIHCFVIEQVRSLRPREQVALRQDSATASPESLPAAAAILRFPRITWLSTSTMLRFAADNKDNYSLGHRILHSEGLLPVSLTESSSETGRLSAKEPDVMQQTAWQIAMGRTKRKHEGLLRRKQGKCLACSLRKAKVGILGGERVRLPSTSTDQGQDATAQDILNIDGVDDYLIAVCTPCAALLGLPACPPTVGPDAETPVQLDWQRIDRERDAQAGWTVFPMY